VSTGDPVMVEGIGKDEAVIRDGKGVRDQDQDGPAARGVWRRKSKPTSPGADAPAAMIKVCSRYGPIGEENWNYAPSGHPMEKRRKLSARRRRATTTSCPYRRRPPSVCTEPWQAACAI
jgi:hypothetical protein